MESWAATAAARPRRSFELCVLGWRLADSGPISVLSQIDVVQEISIDCNCSQVACRSVCIARASTLMSLSLPPEAIMLFSSGCQQIVITKPSWAVNRRSNALGLRMSHTWRSQQMRNGVSTLSSERERRGIGHLHSAVIESGAKVV